MATERFERALKIIAPAAREADCERDLARSFRRVNNAAKIDKTMVTPSKRRKLRRQLAETLRKAINLAVQAAAPAADPGVENLKSYLKEIERADDGRKGVRKFSNARLYSVHEAYLLLAKYSKQPTRYRNGPWHDLARVLHGNERADLFDHMEDYVDFWRDHLGRGLISA
jgi:hypothetical protein